MHMSKVLSSVMAGTTASSSSETACTPSSDSQNGGKQQSMAVVNWAQKGLVLASDWSREINDVTGTGSDRKCLEPEVTCF